MPKIPGERDITSTLKRLKLNLNENKTKLFSAKIGFIFLGYYIDTKRKGPGKKAIIAISQKLNEINEESKNRNPRNSILLASKKDRLNRRTKIRSFLLSSQAHA